VEAALDDRPHPGKRRRPRSTPRHG
jgi:hypothetical protein